MYEGRTRGKRIKYTFSDDDDDEGSDFSTRRSTRNSGISTPGEPAGPTFTASGRQVRTRHHGAYGEILHSGQQDAISQDNEHDRSSQDGNNGITDEGPTSRTRSRSSVPPRQSNGPRGRAHIEGYNALDEMDDESDATSSGNEWDGGDDDEDNVDGNMADDDDVEMADESDMEEAQDELAQQSLVVSLRYQRKPEGSSPSRATEPVSVNGERPSPTERKPPSECPVPTYQSAHVHPEIDLKTPSTNIPQSSITAQITS